MFGATVTEQDPYPIGDDPRNINSFPTFHPLHEPAFNGIKAKYISNFKTIEEFASEILTIDGNTGLENNTKWFLECVIIYDFMAFTAAHLRDVTENARMEMLVDLHTAHNGGNIKSRMYNAFKAIILAVNPSLGSQQPAVSITRDLVPAVSVYESRSTFTPTRSDARTPASVTPNRRLHRTYADMYHHTDAPPLMDSLNVLQHTMNKITATPGNTYWDSGASVCGTGDKRKIQDEHRCDNVTVQGPFGKPCQPTTRGILKELDLECIHIPDMKDTLLSVSAHCAKGHTFLFDSNGCHSFKTTSIARDIMNIKNNGVEVARGLLSNGLYCSVPLPDKLMAMTLERAATPDALMYINATPDSKYEHVHATLGHPGAQGMQWHRKNTPGAQYTDDDANKPRGVCRGCVLGGMRQKSTDHKRIHRAKPSHPGQQLSLDAFSNTTPSRDGFRFCDIYTDLFTGIRYPVFTKSRSAPELVDKTTILLDLHADWNRTDPDRMITLSRDHQSDPPDPRFIRVDAESNYKSTEFLHCAASYRYTLERTPPRDKHANGIAERSVGLVTLKTNVAMLTPNPPVPPCFWDLAMAYSCQTLSFCYNSAIDTSPYFLLHGTHVPFKFLQPFWTPCYVYMGQKN